MTISFSTFETSLAPMFAAVDSAGQLVQLDFLEGRTERDVANALARARGDELVEDSAAVRVVADQISSYVRGELRDFTLDVAPRGTPFQISVWEELRRIPYGETISYAELASRVGRPGAARAVGRANGTNPIAIVIPCHRVIGASGALTGYASGLRIKQALLDIERANALGAVAGQASLAALFEARG